MSAALLGDDEAPTADLIAAERRAYERRPGWELANVAKALSLLPRLNSAQENARLIAVRDIQRERRASARKGGR